MNHGGEKEIWSSINRMRSVAPYPLALGATFAAFLLRQGLEQIIGSSMPPYFTFFPSIMIIALAAGWGPGILSTVTAALLADYYILPQHGFGVESVADAIGLAFFTGMGLYEHSGGTLSPYQEQFGEHDWGAYGRTAYRA